MANEFIARNGIVSKSNLVVSGSLTALSTITAQTLVVQTITSSISSITGSTNFGSLLNNTHTFTGSLNVTGSLSVVTNGTEFQVNSTGVNLGNALTDSHVISGSLRINPSTLIVSSSGNVGIGNTNPIYPLHVSSSAYIYRTDASATNPAQLIASSSAATIITRAGSSADLFLGRSGSANFANIFYADSTVWATSARWTVGMRSGDSNYNIFNESYNASALTILNSNNNIGIGTATPSFPLTRNGVTLKASGSDGVEFMMLSNTDTGFIGGGLVRNSVDLGLVNRTNGNLIFATNTVERMYVTSDGYLRLASRGIQFNGDTSDANSLDDYEEGTWTPTVVQGGFSSITSVYGRYTKIGRVVHCIVDCNINGTGDSNTFIIGGLPFTNLVSGYSANACYFQYINTDNRNLAAITLTSSTQIQFEIVTTASSLARTARGNDFSQGYMNLNITYFTS